MPVTSLWQFLIPDSLLLEIFNYLDIIDLGHVAQVCSVWRRVSYDELLWQGVIRRKWGIKGPISPGKSSWRSEVKRLVYHVPCVSSEIFTEAHVDEVLDVCISHRGDLFCTTSKDSLVVLWKLRYPSTEVKRVNTKDLFNWSLTQYSKFNSDDTLLLVCGVLLPEDIHHFTEVSLGRGAILTIPELRPLQVVNLDPPTLFGAWLTSDIFVGGSLQGLHGAIRIEAHEVPKDVPSRVDWKTTSYRNEPEELFYFRGNKHHQMSILVADVACLDEMQENIRDEDVTESGCTSASGMSESKPDSIYHLHHEEDTTRHHQIFLGGAGDLETDPDFLMHKRLKLNAKGCDSLAEKAAEIKQLNPNILELENNASFWDTTNNIRPSDHLGHQKVDVATSVSLSECGCSSDTLQESPTFADFHMGRSDKIERKSDATRSVSDISETSVCSVCKRKKIDNLANNLNTQMTSAQSCDTTLDNIRLGGSNTTVTFSSEALSDSSSVSITGLSLSSDFCSKSETSTVQAGDEYLELNSRGLDTFGGNRSSNEGTSENFVGQWNINWDRFYNTETSSSVERDGKSLQAAASDSNISGDKLYYNTDNHTDSGSSTVGGEKTPLERIESQFKCFSSISRSCSNRQGRFRKYVCFVSGAHDAIVVQEVTVNKLDILEERLAGNRNGTPLITRELGEYDAKDHYFFIKHCYITGMCLSHDHRYIYFNFREWARKEDEESDSDDEPEDPLRDVSDRDFHEKLKVGVIDLVKMCRVEGLTYEGHIGYSSYPAWYICLGASADYLGSGSENARAYLWDRHYGIKLVELLHKEQVVNGIAFSPVDQETCISVCDDKSIIVWRSRNRIAELIDKTKI